MSDSGSEDDCEDGPPRLSELMETFDIDDPGDRLSEIRNAVLPVLREELALVKDMLCEIFGDGWLELVTPSVHPSAGVTSETRMPTVQASVGYAAKRTRERAYTKFTAQGRRAMILDVRACIAMTGETYGAYVRIQGQPEIRLFEQVWHGYRDECLALLESIAPEIWSDPPFPGPPHIAVERQLGLALRSGADYLCVKAQEATPEWSGPSASWTGQWGAICLWPIFIGVIEAGLDRQPSVRAFHDRLCKWDAADEERPESQDEGKRMSSRLRYQVFKRDGYCCVMCGASASEGARLEADHILPRSRGGTAVLRNLQTLCDRCNRGKKDDLSPDLRAKR